MKAVGSTQGSADVSATGAGSYTIPITIAPGSNGIVPSLALAYSSQSGNGILGLGWGLTGLSVVARQAQTIYHEGETQPVELKPSDRFAMDGAKLFFKAGTVTQDYGGDGNWHGIESENFVNVISHGAAGTGPAWFEAQTIDGVFMEFGNTANSTIVQSTTGTILAWGVTRIRYKDGNYIQFVYANDSQSLRIAEINYTGNTVTGLLPYNKIKFEYKAGRIDANNQFEYGITLNQQHLLDKIIVTTESETVKSYQFTYGNDGVNSYLTSVSESGSDGTSLNSTIFKYGDKPTEFSPSSSDIIQNVEGDEYIGDFNADGLSDLLVTKKTVVNNITYHTEFTVYAKQPTNPDDNLFASVGQKVLPANTTVIQKKFYPESTNFLAHDFNGDGTDDILTAKTSIFGGEWRLDYMKVYTSYKNPSIGYPVLFDSTTLFGSTGSTGKINQTTGHFIFAGDFNGDEIQDIITLTGWSDGSIGANLHSAISTNVFFDKITATGIVKIPVSEWSSAHQIHVLDFNGDGKSDLMVIKNEDCEIFTFEKGAGGYPFARSIFYSTTSVNFQHIIYFGDFNGDKKTDMLARGSLINNTSVPWKKILSTGKGVVEQTFTFDHTPNIVGGQSDDHLTIGDFNGDGKSDIYHGWRITPTSSTLDVYYSQGNNFQFIRNPFSGTIGNNPALASDLNGDSRSDIINRKSFNQPFDIFYFRKEGKENLLEKLANGVGHITEWSYKKLTDAGTFYIQGPLNQNTTNNVNPINNVQPPLYAVYESRAQNGIGGYSIIQYNYEQARINSTGKGFLGFKKITASDLATGIKTVSENQFNATYFDASPYQISTYLISNSSSPIQQTTYAYDFINLTGTATTNRRFWFRANSVTENNTLAGSTATTTYAYEYNSAPVSHGYPNLVTVNNNNTETTVTQTQTDIIYGTPNIYRPGQITVSKTRSGQTGSYAATTKMSYNVTGQLDSKTDFFGMPKKVITLYEYFPLGSLKKTTVTGYNGNDPLPSRSSSTTFDGKERYVLSSINVLMQTSSASYDANGAKWGVPLTVTEVDGLVTTNTYSPFGSRLTANVFGDYTATTTLSWDIDGNKVWKAVTSYSPAGRASSTEWFDILGRSIRTETAAFGSGTIESNTVYDSKGNVYNTEQAHKSGEPYITTTNSYDDYNRLTSTSAGVLGTTSYSYSYSGGNTTITTTTPSGVTSKTTDASGKVISATDNGGALYYTYYNHGGLKEVKNGGTTITSSEYDEYCRQVKLTDANAGITEYLYNALGELTWQKTAKGDVNNMAYDLAGRVTTRTGPEGPTGYEYYTDNSSGRSIGRLKRVTGFVPGNFTEYSYTDRGQVQKIKETIDNVGHETSYSYNLYGDVASTAYPSGLLVTRNFDTNGYPTSISGAGTTLYTTTGMNGQGQVTAYSLGNGKSSVRTFTNGFPTKYETSDGLQNLNMLWDYPKANLTSRNDARGPVNKTETFGYDNLNRLTSATISGSSSFTASYSPNGNISAKTDAGSYSYHATKFNAITGVTNPSPAPIPLQQQDISYTSFMQPEVITEANASNVPFELTYTYGSDYERVKSELKQSGNTINTRFYFADGFEKEVMAGTTRYIQYVAGPAGLIAIIESQNGSHIAHYTYTDHLGSILTVTNSSGTVEAEQSFDAWGRRRNVTSWVLIPPTAATGLPVWLHRGYTGHEHLDQFGLINMNGRLYDPVLGRMLSPDNFVQEPGMTQSYNRYSYAMNNPMVNTDPDGHFWHIVIGAAIGGVVNLGIKIYQGKIHKPKDAFVAFGIGAVAGAVTAATGGAAAGALNLSVASIGGGVVAGAAGSATGGLIQGVGNAVYFKDSYTPKDWLIGVGIGAIAGGIGGGIAHWRQGVKTGVPRNPWTGGERLDYGRVFGSDLERVIDPDAVSEFASNTNVYATKGNPIHKATVDKYLSEMADRSFDPIKNAVGGYRAGGDYIIREGHHRVTAAIIHGMKTNDYSILTQIINNGKFTPYTSAYGALNKIKFPTNWK